MKGDHDAGTGYQPFIDDPPHLGELDRQRFVLLRPGPAVSDCHRDAQDRLRSHLSNLPATYPARAHVTLIGFAAGTRLEDVQDLVSEWSATVPHLQLHVEAPGFFPAPFQVAMLRILKTRPLFDALQSLRANACERGLSLSTITPADRWVFHMSLAYCSRLSAAQWTRVTKLLDILDIRVASCRQKTVEVVAFDQGTEYSGGVYPLSGAADVC